MKALSELLLGGGRPFPPVNITCETQACIINALGDSAGGFRSFRLFLLRLFAVFQLL